MICEKRNQVSLFFGIHPENEFEVTGQSAELHKKSLYTPYVEESVVQIGLRLVWVQKINANQTELVIARIEETIVSKRHISPDGFVDLKSAGVVTCSGLDSYHTTQKIVRLNFAKPNKKAEPIS